MDPTTGMTAALGPSGIQFSPDDIKKALALNAQRTGRAAPAFADPESGEGVTQPPAAAAPGDATPAVSQALKLAAGAPPPSLDRQYSEFINNHGTNTVGGIYGELMGYQSPEQAQQQDRANAISFLTQQNAQQHGQAELAQLGLNAELGRADVGLRQQDLGLRQQLGTTDEDLKRQELGLKEQQLGADKQAEQAIFARYAGGEMPLDEALTQVQSVRRALTPGVAGQPAPVGLPAVPGLPTTGDEKFAVKKAIFAPDASGKPAVPRTPEDAVLQFEANNPGLLMKDPNALDELHRQLQAMPGVGEEGVSALWREHMPSNFQLGMHTLGLGGEPTPRQKAAQLLHDAWQAHTGQQLQYKSPVLGLPLSAPNTPDAGGLSRLLPQPGQGNVDFQNAQQGAKPVFDLRPYVPDWMK